MGSVGQTIRYGRCCLFPVKSKMDAFLGTGGLHPSFRSLYGRLKDSLLSDLIVSEKEEETWRNST